MDNNHEISYLGQLSLFNIDHATRCDAAAAAGFKGVSLFWHEISAHLDAGGSLDELREQAQSQDLQIVQLEFATPAPVSASDAFASLAEEMARAAAVLGCDTVHAVALETGLTKEDVVHSMGLLGEACARHNLSCGLEFVPFLTAVQSLPEAMAIIAEVDMANVGIVFDSLHFVRGGCQWSYLEQLKSGDIVSIQINDGPLARPCDDYNVEAMGLRLLPGEGEFDLKRMIETLRRSGITTPLTLEVINADLNSLPPRDAAKKMARALANLNAIAV